MSEYAIPDTDWHGFTEQATDRRGFDRPTPGFGGGRFQKGVGYPYPRPTRGKGDRSNPGGCYRMSRAAYQARLQNLGHVPRERTHDQSQRLQIEIVLARHRGETFRAVAKRLALKSHAHCWRVAHDYRAGRIPWLPRDEQGLLALRDSLDRDPATERRPASGDAHILPEEYERQRREADTTAALERLRERLAREAR
jgi:hypothetical protein